ncbi:MAG: M48 family metalloprotease [Xanthomonadales bacterium]|nr:M48 family metalloprotease [Gammaproteobacteria bacterium]MBT8053051.1 M48 family metalloprotease [Gammaproteobacteria bacterium]NND56705.1 M48 family metalloprotease [Xanthomonadales bacterium]NNK52690.1 M48 family metalloprotease [Xanthomonadales bacterium]
MMQKLFLTALIATAGISGCSVNPVTGDRNFQIYGSDWEKEVGAQMYAPMKQSQGGEFILDPELTEYVEAVGGRLANQARRKDELDYEFSILNDSTPNAWALPGGKIVINRGLLIELDSEAELAAVLGHEIVHADAAHGARAQSKGMLTQAGAVISMVILGSTIDNQSARQVAMMVPALGAQLLSQKYGRDAERESDEYGMLYMSEAGYDPQGAVELQKTFVELSEGRNEDWINGLFASHPPSMERVMNNQKTAAQLSVGGDMGRDRYQQRVAYLKRVQPAYDAYDEARKAIAEDKMDLAQEKLNRALSIEPRESLFHDLQGDILALSDQHKKALASYQRAVKTNPGFFYGYLREGQMQYVLEDAAPARSSLERSLELMPTAEAHYLLGMLDKDQGNVRGALEHFKVAAGSDSETSQKAKSELVLLDLQNNPGNYIGSRAAVDAENQVWAQIGNLTGVPMRNIVISYAWLDTQGQTREGQKTYRGPLGAGKQDQVRLGFQLENAAELGRRVRVAVTGATAVPNTN